MTIPMSSGVLFREKYGPWAVIAGAAMGLGAEYARQVAAQGVDLVLIDRDVDTLAATCNEVRSRYAVRVEPASVDLGRADVVEALAPVFGEREIGLLVYNAAIGTVAPFLAHEPSHIDAMLDVNCRAPLLLARALVPAMVGRGRGGLVLMSSMSGSFGSAQLT